jgi:hypothetical protein
MSGKKKKLFPAVHPDQTIANIAVKTSTTVTLLLSLRINEPNQKSIANEKNIKN